MSEHTVKAFSEKLEALSAAIAQMGGLAEAQFANAVEAIARRDTTLAENAVGGDKRIDEMQLDIEDRALKLLALRQPMAVDLRETLAAIKIASELERIGDLAKNIAKRAIRVAADVRIPRAIVGLKSMHDLAAILLKDVLDAYSQRDAERAREVWVYDADLDSLEDSVFRDLLTFMMEDPRNISFCAHLLFCSKNIERIGDHATNIAETVVYLVSGETMPTDRPKGRGLLSESPPVTG